MSPAFQNELEALGRKLVWWRARLFLVFGLSIVLASVLLLGLIDLWLRFERTGRLTGWLLFIACAGGTAWFFIKTIRYRYSTQGIAATVEKAFPELDNHLINYVQFSADAGSNPFKTAYLEQADTHWDQVDPIKMKNKKVHLHSWLALVAAILLLLAPGLFFGAAWPRAVVRMLNPFSNLTPISLSHILSVQPGETTVLQGSPLVLSCSVQGLEGHPVFVEVDPIDSRMTRTALGDISSGNEENFARRIPKVTTGFRYRFKAGDATPSAWQTINTRPPSAFSDIQLSITPPAYTGRPIEVVDARTEGLRIPQGSRVTVDATSNTRLSHAGLSASADVPARMNSGGEGLRWSGDIDVSSGRFILLQAEDIHGEPLEEQLGFTLGLDAAPVIEITAPRGRMVLPPGENPRIGFRIKDDYGLTQVAIEKQVVAMDGTKSWTPVKEWDAKGHSGFLHAWTGEAAVRSGSTLNYRVVARDTCSISSNIGSSVTIVFDSPSQAELAKERKKLEAKAVAGLHQVLTLQRENLKATRALVPVAEQADKTQWTAVIERQLQIRQGTRELIDNPLQPLGKLSATVKKLYLNEMNLASQTLTGIPQAAPEIRAVAATKAQQLEERILRQLSSAENAMAQAKVDRRISGLTAMLAKMVGHQAKNLKETQAIQKHKTRVSPLMVDLQDALASDLTEFVASCKADAAEMQSSDVALASTLTTISQLTEDKKIRNDMMLAAERLDQNEAPDSIPYQENSLTKLQSLQALLDGVKLQEEEALQVAMEEGLDQAKEKLARMKDIHKKVLDSMEMLKDQKDKSDEQVEMMEEAYEALVKNTQEAMLEVPTDLHVFMDLNVANEMVEDVFSVYQEIQQSEKSKSWTEDDAFEQAFIKEYELIEMMEETEGKIDDLEQWLVENPDAIAVTTESFDQEELPESGIALGALPTELEDLISDLVEESEELADAADDGAVNHAVGDIETGGPVMEGNITSFAAKGKSGAQRPDHKEQDGRSNVGRQGMSNGETAAGSGTISEGDQDIEARRTADPTQGGQVDLEGEADTNATGGGKLASGKADDLGLSGGVKRLDSNEEGSNEGMAALMAERADSLFAKASMKNIRVESLQTAAHHLRQSADAIAQGDIEQVKEHKRLAVGALVEARTDLQAGPTAAYELGGSAALLDDMVESSPDTAPPQYRNRVSEYFKVLNASL